MDTTEYIYFSTRFSSRGNSQTTVYLFQYQPTELSLVISVTAGGNGYINDYPTGRFLRDAKLYEIGAGTSEVRRWLLGRAFNEMFNELK